VTRLGEAPTVDPTARLEETTLGAYTEVKEGCVLSRVRLGDYSYAERFCDIANAEIGRFASIASFARIGATDHPMARASQHHFLYRAARYWPDAADDAGFFAARRARVARLGHDVWIGHMAMVKPCVAIGHGAVVAMGAVVTKDVAPYAVVAGNPARRIRDRFAPDIAARLIALGWWDWEHARLRAALDDFRRLDVETFLERHGG